MKPRLIIPEGHAMTIDDTFGANKAVRRVAIEYNHATRKELELMYLMEKLS